MMYVSVAVAFLLAVCATVSARPLSIRTLIRDCSIDTRGNPVVLTCPAGCVVTIGNGAPGPRIEVSPACQLLR